MRLRSLELSDFRKFDQPMRLDGLADGLNVLAEPNEFGKSTLLAAIKAVLFEQHRAKNDSIRRMQHHRNATAPVIGLGFELEGGLHRIEKRFLHRDPYARLTLPDGTRIDGDEAEEQLQALLGFAAGGKRGASDESRGVWGALWVDQQVAPLQPVLAEVGRATLHACLEHELGALSGNDHGARIRQQVEAERAPLLDGRDKPRGRWKQSQEELEAADAELGVLLRRRESLRVDIEALAQNRRDLVRLGDPDAEAKLTADLAQARTQRDAVLRHDDQLSEATAALQLAQRARTDAAGERQARDDRAIALMAAEQNLSVARNTESQLSAELADAEATLSSGRDAAQHADGAAEVAARALRRAEAVLALARRAERVERLERQLERAAGAQEDINRLSGALAASPADTTRLRAIEAAETTLERARAALDAQAAEIELELLPEAGDRVRVHGGAILPGTTILRATADTVIEITGIGRVRIRPAIRDRAALERRIYAAEAALRDALAAAGAADPAEARVAASRRRTLEEQLQAATVALVVETPGDEQAGLAAGPEALRNHIAAERSRLGGEGTALGITALPTIANADAVVRAARRDEAEAGEATRAARTGLAGPQAMQERAFKARTVASARMAEMQNEAVRLRRDQDAVLAIESDEALAMRLSRTGTTLEVQQAVVAQLARQRPAETLEAVDARIARLERAAAARSRDTAQLREQRVLLETRIQGQEGEGLDEQIGLGERRREDLRAEHDALGREAAVLTLLRDSLLEAEREARERYIAPLLRRVTPYLQGLFPGVAVALDEDLRISGLTRQAGQEEIQRLSDGTREQVAVLLRLAYADLLREQGRPAMLILDDALAYSDRDRLETMFDVLTGAAKRLQVLVLTCRVDAFERLGANRVRLVTTSPSSG